MRFHVLADAAVVEHCLVRAIDIIPAGQLPARQACTMR
jgi:hypothetical protein